MNVFMPIIAKKSDMFLGVLYLNQKTGTNRSVKKWRSHEYLSNKNPIFAPSFYV